MYHHTESTPVYSADFRHHISFREEAQGHYALEMLRKVFTQGAFKEERKNQQMPLSWDELGVMVVPDYTLYAFHQPVYIVGENSLIQDETIKTIDPSRSFFDFAVSGRRDTGVRASTWIRFEDRDTSIAHDEHGEVFPDGISVSISKDPDDLSRSSDGHFLAYSVGESAVPEGMPAVDLKPISIIVTAGCFFRKGATEYDGLVVVR